MSEQRENRQERTKDGAFAVGVFVDVDGVTSAGSEDEALDLVVQSRCNVEAVASETVPSSVELFPVVACATVGLAVNVHLKAMAFGGVSTLGGGGGSDSESGKDELEHDLINKW